MSKLKLFKGSPSTYRKRFPEWLDPPTCCDACQGPCVLVHNGSALYEGQDYGKWPYIYFCLCCEAATGCHDRSIYPMGRMADRKTRSLRNQVHQLFDPKWRGFSMGRTEAYHWLAELLGIPPWEPIPHIGQMDATTCERAVRLLQQATMTEDFGRRTG